LLRTPWAFFFIIVAVGLSLAAGFQFEKADPDRFAVGIVIEDEGDYGRRLAAEIAGYDRLILRQLDRSEAMRLLRQDRMEGVFVVRADYTAKLRQCDFKNIVEWYTAPSSRAAATVSEPLINGTMRLWLEEKAVSSTREFLAVEGIAYTPADEAAQREMISQIWLAETSVFIQDVMIDGAEGPAADLTDPATPLDASVRWYAVLCVFYLIISASWVLDINKRGLRIRSIQSGGHLWQIMLGTSLAPLLAGLAGYWLMGSLSCLINGGDWLRMLLLSLPMATYLWTVLGLTIFLAAFLKNSLALMFLAPLLTFVNALLGGMISELPDWAGVLAMISQILPGRWLMLMLQDPLAALPFALLCGIGWFAAGIALSELKVKGEK